MGAAAGWEIGRALVFPWNVFEENYFGRGEQRKALPQRCLR